MRMKLVHGLLTKCRIHEPQGALLKGVRVKVRVRVRVRVRRMQRVAGACK